MKEQGACVFAPSLKMSHVSWEDDEDASVFCFAAREAESLKLCGDIGEVCESGEDEDIDCRNWFFEREVVQYAEDSEGGGKENSLQSLKEVKEEWQEELDKKKETMSEEEICSKEQEMLEKGEGWVFAAWQEAHNEDGVASDVEIMAADENEEGKEQLDVGASDKLIDFSDKKSTEKTNARAAQERTYHYWAYSGVRVRFKYLAPHLDEFNGQCGVVRKIYQMGKRIVIFVQPERKPQRDALRRLREKRQNMFADYPADWVPCCLPDIVRIDADGVENAQCKPVRKELHRHYWAAPGMDVTVVHKTRHRQHYDNVKGVITRIVEHNRYKYLYVALNSADLTKRLVHKQMQSKFLKHMQQPHELACKIEKKKYYVRYVQK